MIKSILFSVLISAYLTIANAAPMKTGPVVWISGKVINQSSFNGFHAFNDLQFTYLDQDVIGVKFNSKLGQNYDVTFMFIQNDPVSIYLSYWDLGHTESEILRLCRLSLFVNSSGFAKVTAEELHPDLIHCQLSGDPNKDNFTINLTDGWKKVRKNNEK